jgi:hypothetical protein
MMMTLKNEMKKSTQRRKMNLLVKIKMKKEDNRERMSSGRKLKKILKGEVLKKEVML